MGNKEIDTVTSVETDHQERPRYASSTRIAQLPGASSYYCIRFGRRLESDGGPGRDLPVPVTRASNSTRDSAVTGPTTCPLAGRLSAGGRRCLPLSRWPGGCGLGLPRLGLAKNLSRRRRPAGAARARAVGPGGWPGRARPALTVTCRTPGRRRPAGPSRASKSDCQPGRPLCQAQA